MVNAAVVAKTLPSPLSLLAAIWYLFSTLKRKIGNVSVVACVQYLSNAFVIFLDKMSYANVQQ